MNKIMPTLQKNKYLFQQLKHWYEKDAINTLNTQIPRDLLESV